MNLKLLYQQVRAAAHALREPLESPVFNPWPLQGPLEFLEQSLKNRKSGLKVICDSGLCDVLLFGDEDPGGFESWGPGIRRTFFICTRYVGEYISVILDKVERDPTKVDPKALRRLLLLWARELRSRKLMTA